MAIGLRVNVIGMTGLGDQISSIFEEMAAEVRRSEPGCLRYDVGRSADRRDDFIVWEIYADQEAFDQHRITGHFERLMNGRLPALVQERQRAVYEIVS